MWVSANVWQVHAHLYCMGEKKKLLRHCDDMNYNNTSGFYCYHFVLKVKQTAHLEQPADAQIKAIKRPVYCVCSNTHCLHPVITCLLQNVSGTFTVHN